MYKRQGFWIAKAAVKFDNLRIALFVDHQARAEKTGVGVAFCRHAFHGWPDDSFHRALMNLIGHYWRRGVRDVYKRQLYYMHKIVDGLLRENDGRRVPVTLFTKGGGQWLEAMAETEMCIRDRGNSQRASG